MYNFGNGVKWMVGHNFHGQEDSQIRLRWHLAGIFVAGGGMLWESKAFGAQKRRFSRCSCSHATAVAAANFAIARANACDSSSSVI